MICWECGEGIKCTCPPAWEESVTKIKDPDACEFCGEVDGCAADGCVCDDCVAVWSVPAEDDEERFDTLTFQSVFTGIFDEAFTLLVDRQRKYGPDNIFNLGLFGVFDRLASDKIERVRRSFNGVIEHGRVRLDPEILYADETLEDALLDIANYALIMLALKRGVWGYPLAPEEGSK